MAIDLRKTEAFRCYPDERGKIQIVPGSARSEREEAEDVAAAARSEHQADCDRAGMAWCALIAGIVIGASSVLMMAVVGWAISLR